MFFYPVLLCAALVTDGMGNLVEVTSRTKRIISLAPDITETLFAISAGEQIVGVIAGSDYPERALSIPKVGSYRGIDIERIISLKPDLIVTWSYNFIRQIQVLKKFGIPIYHTQPKNWQDVPKTMIDLGQLTGKISEALRAARAFKKEMHMLRQTYHGRRSVSVFYQIDAYSLITINKDSWINQIIELCGGRNIFSQAQTISPVVSLEAVVTRDPEVILNNGLNDQWQSRFQKWPKLFAVKHQHLFNIQADWIARAGPRLILGAKRMCQVFEKARQVTSNQ